MTKKVERYLIHPENRMTICRANRCLFAAKGEDRMAEVARLAEYNWLAKAESHDLTEHY